MPFPPKKPEEDDKKLTPTAEPSEGKPAPDAPKSEGKPAPAPSKPGAPKASSKGGSPAPETPGQGEPDVKPHPEPGAKKEPEADKQALPKEADKAAAKEQPKGLPTLATMTKAEAESAAKDPMNNPHVQRLATLVQGLAKIVQEHHARLGAMPLPGQATPTGQQQQMPTNGKPGMPGQKPQMGAMGAKPGMPGTKPGAMPPRPMMPGVAGQGVRPGQTATTPMAQLSLEQINSIMSIVDSATNGRISRQGAAMLIARGFGLDEKTALAMVSPEGGNPNAMSPAPMGAPVDELSALNPEEEIEGEEGEEFEEEEELEEGEEGDAPVAGEEDDDDPFGTRRPAKRGDAFDPDQPRDEYGRFSDEGGGGASASPGKPFIAYRVAKAGHRDLNNRNAGNAQAVAAHIAKSQSNEGPAPEGGFGDTLHVYKVTTKSEFGKYQRMSMGKAMDPTDNPRAVGRNSKDWKGQETGDVSYSFPESGEFDYEHLAEIPISKLNEHVKEMAKTYQGGKYASQIHDFDTAGSRLGGETIRDYVRNSMLEKEITAGSLGVPREQMPQIPKEEFQNFKSNLEAKGVSVSNGSMRVSDLKPTQATMNMPKVIGMRTMSKEKLTKPVIVSSDGHILDGHHRWAALKLNDPDAEIKTVNIGMPIAELVKEARGFGGAKYKTVHDSADRPWFKYDFEEDQPRDENGRWSSSGGGGGGDNDWQNHLQAPAADWEKHRVKLTPERNLYGDHKVGTSKWWSTSNELPRMSREESRAKAAELRAKAEDIRAQTRAGTWTGVNENSGWNVASRIEEEEVQAVLRAGYNKGDEFVDPSYDDLDSISVPGHLYRGMEEAEFEATVGAGKGVHSKNRYSVQDIEGTNFGWEAGTAHSYANIGKSSPLHTGKPNYIVEVKPDETITYNKTAGYPQTPVGKGLAHKQITRVWKVEGRDAKLVMKEIDVPQERKD